ncbi:MAG TPA: hypothetical protein VK308_05865 [Pyrinomonadaceae bacterium]|nr:hypothetical protein [Pyrinomonadaceae bacterium]
MNTASEKNTRRIQRLSLALPVRVELRVGDENAWNEITRLNDISAFGAGFNLQRPVKRGRLVQMTIPLPRQLRCYDYAEPQYRIWGLVRNCITKETSSNEESHAIGVAFIGKRPPPSYYDDPSRLFEISHQETKGLWSVIEASVQSEENKLPQELRRHTRFSIPANVVVEKIDADGNVTVSEQTVTENLSVSGTAIFSTLDAEIGEFVRIKSDQYNVSIISVVRGRRLGQDSIPRLHVEFVDRFFPLEGIE